MDFLEEIQAPDCIRLFYMHNCITKDTDNTGQDAIATAPSIKDIMRFGGGFRVPSTNIRQMSKKNITEHRKNADIVGLCSNEEGSAI